MTTAATPRTFLLRNNSLLVIGLEREVWPATPGLSICALLSGLSESPGALLGPQPTLSQRRTALSLLPKGPSVGAIHESPLQLHFSNRKASLRKPSPRPGGALTQMTWRPCR